MEYRVVFDNFGRNNPALKGIRTWMCFKDKQGFEERYCGERQLSLKVLAEVSECEAHELTRQTPRSAFIAIAFEWAVLSEQPFFIDELYSERYRSFPIYSRRKWGIINVLDYRKGQ